MNKRFSRILSIALVLMLVLALAPTAFAAETLPKDPSGEVQFDKVLKANQYAVLPATLTFEFKLEPAAANAVGGWEARTGSLTGITCAAADGTTTGDVSYNNATGVVTVTFRATDKTANVALESNKGFVFNFNPLLEGGDSAVFNKPGVYRYTLTETSKNDARVAYGTESYYIDVFVQYNETASKLEIANIVVSTGTTYTQTGNEYDNGSKVDAKVTSGGAASKAKFENAWKSYDLTITKSVTGNQGDRTKPFAFSLASLGSLPDGTYTVQVGSTSNQTTITVSQGTVTPAYTFNLKNGESITIKDLPYGATWSVSETDYTSEGYTTTVTPSEATNGTDTGDASTSGNTASDSSTGIRGTTTVTYENNKQGNVPTGVLLTVAPFAALMAVGAAGMTVMMRKKREE